MADRNNNSININILKSNQLITIYIYIYTLFADFIFNIRRFPLD